MRNWKRMATWGLAGLAVVWLAVYISQPCTLSFEVHQGLNFNQPYPTYHHCGLDSSHAVQITDIHGNSIK